MRCASLTCGLSSAVIAPCAVVGDKDGYRTCADHRLRHTPEHNPLQTRLSVCAHHHEVVLSILCVMVDALSGSAVIGEYMSTCTEPGTSRAARR